MRTAATLLGLLVANMALAADPAPKLTVRPDGSGAITIGQSVYLSYPYDSIQAPRLKRLIINKKFYPGMKEVHTGPENAGNNNVLYRPTRVGTLIVEAEVFVGPPENNQTKKYRYTLVVKKKDDE